MVDHTSPEVADPLPRAGDPRQRADEEFTAFVRASYPRLVRMGYLLTSDAGLAEDLVQTVLARLYLRWDRLDEVRDRGALSAYARTALTRQATSWWRRAWRAERPSATLPEPPATLGATDPSATVEVRDELIQALRRLPPRQRAAVVLRYFEDLTETATAQVMGCSVGTVRAHTSRGVARLRELVTEPDAGPTARTGGTR
ncbi:MAG: SigE family RNA polymerase sigma factor [Kineosporiaceae bacterium]|nr:SigE family RNA polymerase sigma factor [Kineosporiaceae bacterium]MBK7621187.1 SigE family RNA polymerase sigma factor [Kineosporiaceae bacterium]MBK8076042.1 SigE family RNA polymerase sigma factor [Kineosporiaceae bacterium]